MPLRHRRCLQDAVKATLDQAEEEAEALRTAARGECQRIRAAAEADADGLTLRPGSRPTTSWSRPEHRRSVYDPTPRHRNLTKRRPRDCSVCVAASYAPLPLRPPQCQPSPGSL